MRISDWSSDVCSSDLGHRQTGAERLADVPQSLAARNRQLGANARHRLVAVNAAGPHDDLIQAITADFEPTHRLLHRLLVVLTHRHPFYTRLDRKSIV